ncbi:MAG TPA: hypothetical protein VEX62_13355 [Candidatus Limnocylindrales bacterium]|nr:hypothetical protein [Candidatus Limnocylindrales bacterium]
MDNDLMARRLRPPSEPSKSSATSSTPFAPVPSALPWETEPPAPASREEIPWDTPAAEAWPPDPAADEAAATAWSPSPVPTETFEPTDASLVWPPVADATAAGSPAVDAMAAETDTAAVATPASAPEAPWDRPSDDDFDRPMDARVDGPSWDEPSPFTDFDDSPVFDDRPPDMLEAFHSPVAVAVEERPREEQTVDAVASTFVEPERETDPAFSDPYDETAPVVAEVAESATVPQWPSWNGNGAAATAEDDATSALSAVAQVETEDPVQSAFIPWDETGPEDPPRFGPAPTPAAVMPETSAESLGPTTPDDLFASPPVSEDELPEPDEVAPWDFVADDDQPQLFESSVAEVATVDFEPIADAEPIAGAEADAVADAEPSVEAESEPTAEADAFEAWLALAATGVATDAEAEADAEADAESEPVPEPEMATGTEVESDFEADLESDAEEAEAAPEPEQVQIDIPAPSAFPATIYASGPESGLPANVVLRIELSIVDDAKRLNVTNVASASEFAPRVEEIVAAQSAEPAEPPEQAEVAEAAQATEPVVQATEPVVTAQADDSAWPAIWDPDRPDSGFATPAAIAANPSDAWAWTDPTPAQTPYGLTAPTDTWPEVDRPQDAFADSADMSAAMPIAPLAPLAANDESAAASAGQASPRISTIAEPQSDLWFLSAEPETVAEEAAGETAVEKPGMSLLTVGLTIGMAILVIVLVLVFIQLMTSLLG